MEKQTESYKEISEPLEVMMPYHFVADLFCHEANFSKTSVLPAMTIHWARISFGKSYSSLQFSSYVTDGTNLLKVYNFIQQPHKYLFALKQLNATGDVVNTYFIKLDDVQVENELDYKSLGKQPSELLFNAKITSLKSSKMHTVGNT